MIMHVRMSGTREHCETSWTIPAMFLALNYLTENVPKQNTPSYRFTHTLIGQKRLDSSHFHLQSTSEIFLPSLPLCQRKRPPHIKSGLILCSSVLLTKDPATMGEASVPNALTILHRVIPNSWKIARSRRRPLWKSYGTRPIGKRGRGATAWGDYFGPGWWGGGQGRGRVIRFLAVMSVSREYVVRKLHSVRVGG